MLCRALDAAGLRDYRIGLGDAALYPTLMAGLGLTAPTSAAVLQTLARRDFVALEAEVDALGLDDEAASLLVRTPQLRGGPELLSALPSPLADALGGLRLIHELLEADVAARIILDLGLVRNLGYYTGRCSRYTTPPSAAQSAAAVATTTCSRASGARCPPSASP